MVTRSTQPAGITSSKVTNIPDKWSAQWFRTFISTFLQPADIRNTQAGTGIMITPGASGPATVGMVSLTTELGALLQEPYLIIGAPAAGSGITAYRQLAVQTGVLTETDAGAENTLTIGVAANGIGNAQLRKGAATSVVGNATAAAANLADIVAAADQQILAREGGALVFTGAPSLSGGIGLNTQAAPAQVTGFGTPTGNTVIANFPGASATLAQTSAAVAEILTVLKAMGVIGA